MIATGHDIEERRSVLNGDASGARHVMRNFVPALSREQYLAHMRTLTTTRTFSYRVPQ